MTAKFAELERLQPFIIAGRNFAMSKSEQLRDQARRAERLATTISDHDASKTLRSLAKEYDEEADRLEDFPDNSHFPKPGPDSSVGA